MAKSVTRREKTRKRHYVERKKQREQRRRLQQQIDKIVREVVQRVTEQALLDEVTQLLGRAKGERRHRG